MNWISVEDDLPKNGDVVLVLCLTTSPDPNSTNQSLRPHILEGFFHRSMGWSIFFYQNRRIYVKYWQKRPDIPDEVFNEKIL